LKANPGIPTALAADVSMALTAFDDSLSLEARLEYVSANKAALECLEKWAPTDKLTVACHALQDPNLSFHGVSWGDFKSMVDSMRGMHKEKVKSPKIIDTVALMAMHPEQGHEWVGQVLREACSVRFGMAAWHDDSATLPEVNVVANDKEMFSA
jgi:hypothetical protein